jgi:hypothetical protein
MIKSLKIGITVFITFTALSVMPANAASKKIIWKENDIEIGKFCDGANLIYLSKNYGWNGSNPTFFVSPNDPQCKKRK